MTFGVDTTFLVQLEVESAPGHEAARAWLRHVIERGSRLALAPQVLTEFIHVATDRARFERPLSMSAAAERALAWWTAREVEQVHPDDNAVSVFFDWLVKHRLGRKRLLDTMLAATYFAHGVTATPRALPITYQPPARTRRRMSSNHSSTKWISGVAAPLCSVAPEVIIRKRLPSAETS